MGTDKRTLTVKSAVDEGVSCKNCMHQDSCSECVIHYNDFGAEVRTIKWCSDWEAPV